MSKKKYRIPMTDTEVQDVIKAVDHYRDKLAKEMREEYGEEGKQEPDILGEDSTFVALAEDYRDARAVFEKLFGNRQWYKRSQVICIKEAINAYMVELLKMLPCAEGEDAILGQAIHLDLVNERCLKILNDSNPLTNPKNGKCATLEEMNEFFRKNA